MVAGGVGVGGVGLRRVVFEEKFEGRVARQVPARRCRTAAGGEPQDADDAKGHCLGFKSGWSQRSPPYSCLTCRCGRHLGARVAGVLNHTVAPPDVGPPTPPIPTPPPATY